MVFLIRHARPDWDRTDMAYHLPPGPPLTETGISEAHELADYLADTGIVQLFSSPLERCVHTAQIVGRHLGLEVVIHPGLIEGQPGEGYSQQVERLLPIFEQAWRESQAGRPTALFSHGGPIQVLMLELGFSPIETKRYTSLFDHHNILPTAGVWQITCPNGKWAFALTFMPGASSWRI